MTQPKTQKPSPSRPTKQHPEKRSWYTFLKADTPQLAVQIFLLDGTRQSWPYAHLVSHTLKGGKLTIWFTEHIVTVRGRHLEKADEGLRLQSLVFLREDGTRREEMLGEPEIPEDQPAIDSIKIDYRGN